jgi:hypothetical protein
VAAHPRYSFSLPVVLAADLNTWLTLRCITSKTQQLVMAPVVKATVLTNFSMPHQVASESLNAPLVLKSW